MKLKVVGEYGYRFKCPGCKHTHSVPTQGPNAWAFNGNLDKPTFTPSVSVKTGHYTDFYKAGDDCWCTYNEAHASDEPTFRCGICHFFVKDGRLEFQSDCTHEFKSKTVEMEDVVE